MEPVKDIISKTKETILRFGMIDPGDLVVVAVSGGPDSVCLLDVMHQLSAELEMRLLVAHYNHGLRGSEDEYETLLVSHLADSLGLPFEMEKDTSLRDDSSSLEARARDSRYRFLEMVMEKHQAQKIALGHNLNDQAETVLMRLLRGSGTSGLAGIPPIRDNKFLRPLIEIRREYIEVYLKERGLPCAMDSSNLDTRHLRNRIRLELMPMLREYQPQILEHLGRVSVILRDEDRLLELQVNEWVEKEAEHGSNGYISLQLSSFLELPKPFRNRAIRHIIKKTKKNLRLIECDHIQSVSKLADSKNPQGMINLPNGFVVRRVYNQLLFGFGAKESLREFSYHLKGPGIHHLEHFGRSISLEEAGSGLDSGMIDKKWTAYVDAGRLNYPLVVRNFRPGDRFRPLGMEGHKKLKDFFIDLKVPSDVRSTTPILTSQGDIVWVCGFRIDEGFKVTPQTKKVLKITIS